jgi:glycosyltransferase involved in cell wall biosynthesis
MACGLPVITTDVGGNPEVVASPTFGTLVPFGDQARLEEALSDALSRSWDRDALVAYARDNCWEQRVAILLEAFRGAVVRESGDTLRDRAVRCT